MTSRLKRKLNDIGVDPSSSKATENFCLIGTPLPPLEKSKDTGEFVPLWKQEVRDEKGRRRLHGAFTGGFSAGYFNTVGSKEGWTPATFVSSRGDRAKKKVARPEDYMDEEDLAELRDSQKIVDTSQQADLEGDIFGRTVPEDDSVVSAIQAALQPPPQDSPGMRILKRMGWRPGHGIGPKVTFEQRKRQEQLSFVAPSLLRGQTVSTLEDNDEEAKKHMYPPLNTVVPVFKKKEDSHGLGFVPGKGLSEIVADSSHGGAKKGPNISAGFGLGALNDADEDDLDVYDNGLHPSSSSRRLAFDEDDDDERIAMGPSRNRNQPTSKESKGEKYFFKDGRPVLEGFVASDKPVIEDKWFPLPDLPKGWTPDPRRVWEKDKENLSGDAAHVEPAAKLGKGRGKSELTAGERGKLLGETPLPTAPKSVFDYLSPKDRERLKKMAAGATSLPAHPQPRSVDKERSPSPGPAPPAQAAIPRLDPQAARSALQGFQPFTNDPVKQARYTAFLQAQIESSDALPFGPFVEQSADEFRKELEDYVRAAHVFRPVSASMAGRFQSAAVVEVVGSGQEGLRRLGEGKKTEEAENDAETYLTRPKKEEEKEEQLSAKDHAARSGMFGPLTREVKPWQPTRLLCKRFGVKDPNPDMSTTTDSHLAAGSSSTVTQKLSNAPHWEKSELLALANTGTVSTETRNEDAAGSSHTLSSQGGGRRDISNIGLGNDETQGQDTLTYTRPGREIFKAIFASDDEDSEDEDEDKGKDKEEDSDTKTTKTQAHGSTNGTDSSEAIAVAPSAAMTAPTSSLYTPSTSNGNLNDAAGTVDIATFKPTFVRRTDRQIEKEKEKDMSGKSKSHKKDKDKKKKHKTLVSFDVDEEGTVGGSSFTSRSDDKKSKKKDRDKDKSQVDEDRKKRRKDRHEREADDEEMWVEKPPPEIVKDLASTPVDASMTSEADRSIQEGPSRGRKRAIDFM